MSGNSVWRPLHEELARWQEAGKVARFWWRDDDAIEPTAALDRLLGLANAHETPLTVAVVPAKTGPALSERLSAASGVSVAVHGWSHENHAPPQEKKQELGGHRLAEAVLGELYSGFLTLQRLHPARFIPMLVPPWNRIDGSLVSKLPALGFECMSAFGRAAEEASIPLLNTHIDVMGRGADRKGPRVGKPHDELVSELVTELQDRFEGRHEPVGLLTHHLAHDATAWKFTEGFLAETADHPAIAWKPATALVKDQMSTT
ncbi:polysaccharide deacetylase family protein [Rhizobium sullae]|uniref:polysaccharide deacetylase family protein n=1 Tax=Rhizobium sullae TaxID=50338 RepID=UPI000B364593|nr:polysaccharide deacetylase family protein [Rhizobium sullae]